jgi:Zn-dependent membrane protease YugP
MGFGTYLLFMLVPLAFGLYAQFRVKAAFGKYMGVGNSAGLSGAEAAYEMLRTAGLERTVGIERHEGFLSDHYDPSAKVLRLSPDVYDKRSLAAVGVACHEAGHALQDATNYAPLTMRNAIVPTANIGSQAGIWMIIIGMIFLHSYTMAVLGLILFSAVVVFQFVNLPVEFNASARAKEMIGKMGIVRSREEAAGVAEVLDAAALTYVAATVSAVATLLYYGLMIFGGGRRE